MDVSGGRFSIQSRIAGGDMGEKLTETVIQGTGLPEHMIRDEFQVLLEKHGLRAETLTLEDLRLVMADYLQDVFLQMKTGS